MTIGWSTLPGIKLLRMKFGKHALIRYIWPIERGKADIAFTARQLRAVIYSLFWNMSKARYSNLLRRAI